MRKELTREHLVSLMKELARSAPPRGVFNVYLVGGTTAVYLGFRDSSVDADLYSDRDEVFADIQKIKERRNLNIEFARPEDFVPPLPGSEGRHVFIDRIGAVSFHHYDPYAQVLSKIVRGFQRDLDDARKFVSHGMVDPANLQTLVEAIPDAAYARYPSLSRSAVERAVEQFLAEIA
jgi:hypothetical protein